MFATVVFLLKDPLIAAWWGWDLTDKFNYIKTI